MPNSFWIFLTVLLLAAPVGVLAGVITGAWLFHRISKGMSPAPAISLPTLRRREPKKEPKEEPQKLPQVRA
jgi:hypothetical protein